MHNRKKLDRPPTDAEVAALEKKTQTYASLVSIIFQRRAAKDMTAETLSLVGKLIKNNPDFYSLWNFRREILLHMNTGLQECTNQQKYNASNANDLRDDELNLSAEGILRNPKSCM
jgi:geranylgeranyl transferase type-2 subunit alpha